ncbi:MAG TPA: type II CAAX endopeptidase family protein [Puia sp.]|nr:type II CAAX endopeptidase family protein [Puia sp.]
MKTTLLLETIFKAVGVGILVLLAGTIPRNLLFSANLSFINSIPWAAPVAVVGLCFFWKYLHGWGPPVSTAEWRRAGLRANALTGRVWCWALLSGILGIVALVLVLRMVNRLVVLPEQRLPDLNGAPDITVAALLLIGAPIAGVVEEAAFRGYMQGPIEKRCGMPVAILITGTMFAVAHLDFTWVLWPYYVAVAALYGMITHMTGSILPSIVLHTSGNLYSNLDLWLSGHAEWQAPARAAGLIRGMDKEFWMLAGASVICVVACGAAFWKLSAVRPGMGAGQRTGTGDGC